MLASLNLSKTIPVGNSDAGSYFNNKVMLAIDYGVCTFLVHVPYILHVYSCL